MGMIDLPMVGQLYTWFNGDGRSMSRIDHFIVTKKLIQLWGITSQWVGVRDIPYHYPVVLKGSKKNWGPKPFKFFNCWLEYPSFGNLIA